MAARKTAVPEPEAPVAAQPYDMGFDAQDVTLPRMRVVGKQAKLVDLDIARPGAIAIGNGADDEDSLLFADALKGEGVRFYVLAIRVNYACGFDGPKGTWNEGDPEMPPDAKRQYNYTLYVPAFDNILPVLYTAGGTAAREARGINTKLAKHVMAGAPYELCFEMTTRINTSGTNSWPGPVFKLVKPDEAEIALAKSMHDAVVGSRRQLAASSADSGPSF